MIASFPGRLIACDNVALRFANFAHRQPDYIVTLEDGDNMRGMFDWDYEAKPPVIASTRTKPYLFDHIRSRGLPVTIWKDPLLEVIWNVGMMGWYYAWKELHSKKVYLTGFDHLLTSTPYLMEQLWQDTFYEFKFHYAPKSLETFLIPGRNHEFKETELSFPGFKNLNQYIAYRQKRDTQVISKIMGNNPEYTQPMLL